MDTAIFLSGTTRGATLEGIGRSFVPVLRKLGIELRELSLLDLDHLLAELKNLELSRVRFVLSCVGMGMEMSITKNGKQVNLWEELRIPVVTLHGDSPAYFFDRHIVPTNNVVSLYAFAEHYELRRRLPRIHGPIGILPPIMLNEVSCQEMDWKNKRKGALLFLKNGKDPRQIKRLWASSVDSRTLSALIEIADELEKDLDSSASNQIDDIVTRYFDGRGIDIQYLTKLRLFCIAQLDDYLRAVKCTRMVRMLMKLPVQIRGNNWHHVDFTGAKATYVDKCDYVESIGLIRGALGVIDMSPNTASYPHDRVMRAYGANTLCLTNARQEFLRDLPYQEQLTFTYEANSLEGRVADVLSNRDSAIERGRDIAEAFRRSNPPERSFERMLDYAALVKLDRSPSRPEGMQDFFVWPPQTL